MVQVRRFWRASPAWAKMLIVHGLGEHSGRYEQTAAAFAGAGIEVISFDLIGHGAGAGPRGHVESWEVYLRDVEERLEAIRIQGRPLVLMGHSMGALIALAYTLGSGPDPDSLVLSALPIGTAGAAWQRLMAAPLARIAPRLRLSTRVSGDQLSRDPSVGEAYFADPLVETRVSTRLGAEFYSAVARARHGIDRLEVPTLLLHGGLDSLVPPVPEAAVAGLPHVELRIYPALRHEILNEPEGLQVADDVVAWLRQRTADGRMPQ